MKNNKPGFTLIELLVVVLIIGILAAVALPQYQMAVNKSRVTQAYVMLRALAGSQERYFLETGGTYANRFDQLDVFMDKSCTGNPCTVGPYTYTLWTNPQRQIDVGLSTIGINLSYFYADPDPSSVYYTYGVRKGWYKCDSKSTPQGKKLCAGLSTGTQIQRSTIYYWKH